MFASVAVAHAAQHYISSAVPRVLPDGHLADTREVAVAKVAHYAEHVKALSASGAIPVIYKYAFSPYTYYAATSSEYAPSTFPVPGITTQYDSEAPSFSTSTSSLHAPALSTKAAYQYASIPGSPFASTASKYAPPTYPTTATSQFALSPSALSPSTTSQQASAGPYTPAAYRFSPTPGSLSAYTSSRYIPAASSLSYKYVTSPPNSHDAEPLISSDGFVTDTAEVSKAKASHYAAHAAAIGAPVEPYLKYLEQYA